MLIFDELICAQVTKIKWVEINNFNYFQVHKIASMRTIIALFFIVNIFTVSAAVAQPKSVGKNNKSTIKPGAERLEKYLPLLKNKTVALFANNTSTVGNSYLADTLVALGVKLKVIFGPEHGFRGTADAGEKVGNSVDEKTGVPVVSLYGSKQRPAAEDLKDIDILLFDIQDVGVRFYTYISSLEDYLKSAMEFNKPVIVLDRPNPNGFYVDGPVLDKKYKSHVGMQSIPIVYGMTIGEYAKMLIGEGWIENKSTNPQPLQLTIIPCENYTHKSKYVLPVKPSPNLPNIQSIYLYPSTCLFEGTSLSEGRGTDKPFQVFGSPLLPSNLYSFTPNPNEGAKSSKHYGKVCYGWDLSGTPEETLAKIDGRIQLKWIIEAYKLYPLKDSFFLIPKSGNMEQSFINKLTGTNEFWQQIRNGVSEADIKKSWEPALSNFKAIRKKYLLYPDFE